MRFCSYNPFQFASYNLELLSLFFSSDELQTPVEEFELSPSLSQPIGVGEVIDLLQAQYAIITGGKSKEGCPVITFPDHGNFQSLSDLDYQKLMLYLTSVPS